MMQTEYSALSTNTEPSTSKRRKWWTVLAVVFFGALIGGLVIMSQQLLSGNKAHSKSLSVISTSSKDYDYSVNKYISYLSQESTESYISQDCTFTSVDNTDGTEFNDEHESLLKKLLLTTEDSVTHYQVTTISKPKYTVEWIFGTKTSNNENEHFTVVFQIDPNDNNNIFEVYLFTSKCSDESPDAMYHRLFNAFDFNKNGVLCITEFPSLMGAISGLGNIEMSNEILSYMSNIDNHIKFEENEFVELCMNDDNGKQVSNFGDLRHIVQNAIIDGYLAYVNDENTCFYYDLSWNCVTGTDYYNTDEETSALLAPSDSIFASVCCTAQA